MIHTTDSTSGFHWFEIRLAEDGEDTGFHVLPVWEMFVHVLRLGLEIHDLEPSVITPSYMLVFVTFRYD